MLAASNDTISNLCQHLCMCYNALNSFNFTKLDKEEPSKPFKFTLCLDTNQNYQLSNVTPPLDEVKTKVVVDNLNKDGKSGFNSFAVGMSKSILVLWYNLI